MLLLHIERTNSKLIAYILWDVDTFKEIVIVLTSDRLKPQEILSAKNLTIHDPKQTVK